MQTKLNILASAILGVSGLCILVGHNTPALVLFIIGILLYLAAYLSKDKKDQQIEEIHAITTNNSKSDHMNDSRNIAEEFLNQQHVFIFSQFDSDITKMPVTKSL